MVKKKKKSQSQAQSPQTIQDLKIELEQDAMEMFLQEFHYGDFSGQDVSEVAEPSERPKSKKLRQRRKAVASLSLDLHGFTVIEAQSRLDRLIKERLAQGQPFELKIITGKGLHSGAQGPVLPQAMYDHIRRVYKAVISWMDDPIEDARLSGMPIRGYFRVGFQPHKAH